MMELSCWAGLTLSTGSALQRHRSAEAGQAPDWRLGQGVWQDTLRCKTASHPREARCLPPQWIGRYLIRSSAFPLGTQQVGQGSRTERGSPHLVELIGQRDVLDVPTVPVSHHLGVDVKEDRHVHGLHRRRGTNSAGEHADPG